MWDHRYNVGYLWNLKVDGNSIQRIIASYRFNCQIFFVPLQFAKNKLLNPGLIANISNLVDNEIDN